MTCDLSSNSILIGSSIFSSSNSLSRLCSTILWKLSHFFLSEVFILEFSSQRASDSGNWWENQLWFNVLASGVVFSVTSSTYDSQGLEIPKYALRWMRVTFELLCLHHALFYQIRLKFWLWRLISFNKVVSIPLLLEIISCLKEDFLYPLFVNKFYD